VCRGERIYLVCFCSLIDSVLEYGSVCYAGMAKTHMLLLERIHYRALRISTTVLGVLSGIPWLRHRLFYLNFRYVVNTFQKNGHPLRDKVGKLNDHLSPQKSLIPFHDVSGLDILPEVGYTRHELGAILSIPRVNRSCAFRCSCRYVSNHCSTRIKGGYCIVLSIEFI
jgi:hypothetical protein